MALIQNSIIYQIIGSDFYANIISTMELFAAIIAIVIGGEKVNELLAEYRRKRVEATFGFYINLGYFVKRIRPLISTDDNKPLTTFNLLSPNESIRKNGYQELGEKIRQVSLECLQYLSSKSDQVPPASSNSEREEWKKNIDAFVVYLNQFYLIGSGVFLPNLSTDDGIINYYKEILRVLNYIEKKVEDEASQLFIDMQGDN